MKAVFEFKDYREYLRARLPTQGETRGQRARLARLLKCQSSYLSQILGGTGNLSLEHAASVDEFLGHSADESDYFLLLVHFARAGSKTLQRHYQAQMDRLLKNRQLIAQRIGARGKLRAEIEERFYSSWYYAAMQVLILLPQCRTLKEIAARLALPPSLVKKSLQFLTEAGLATEKNGTFHSGNRRLHLPTGSPLLAKHHVNWRLRALQALDHDSPNNLHYSAVVAISEKAQAEIRAVLLNAIEAMERSVALPEEDRASVVCLDFFDL